MIEMSKEQINSLYNELLNKTKEGKIFWNKNRNKCYEFNIDKNKIEIYINKQVMTMNSGIKDLSYIRINDVATKIDNFDLYNLLHNDPILNSDNHDQAIVDIINSVKAL